MKKYGLIVGISDYKSISDLSFCDEDATDWYKFLKSKGYEITLFGDNNIKNYPKYDGLATESTVRTAFRKILQEAGPNDIVVFATAGHGHGKVDGTGKGDSFICMYSCNPNRDVDCYWDYELLADLKTAVNRPKVFIFIDHCHSGGFLDELKNVPNVACFTTCSAKGYGYDFSPKQNGAWTYTFLEKGLIEQFGGDAPIDKVFDWASANYKLITGDKSVNDLPQKINNISNDFRL